MSRSRLERGELVAHQIASAVAALAMLICVVIGFTPVKAEVAAIWRALVSYWPAHWSTDTIGKLLVATIVFVLVVGAWILCRGLYVWIDLLTFAFIASVIDAGPAVVKNGNALPLFQPAVLVVAFAFNGLITLTVYTTRRKARSRRVTDTYTGARPETGAVRSYDWDATDIIGDGDDHTPRATGAIWPPALPTRDEEGSAS